MNKGFIAVGDRGLILQVGGFPTSNDEHFGQGVSRHLTDDWTIKVNLRGVGRSRLDDGLTDDHITVGEDGWAFLFSRSSGRWLRIETGTKRHLNAVAFAPGKGTAWAVGDEGTILRTTNRGNKWAIQDSGTTRHLRAVTALDAKQVWVAGDEGELLKTGDGGATWIRTNPTGVTKHLRGIGRRPGIVFAAGDDGKIVFRYKDKWGHASITGKHLRAVAIAPNNVIIVAGDDGRIGRRKAVPLVPGDSDDNNWKWRKDLTSKHLRGAAAHDEQHWAVVGDEEFITTEDGGASWSRFKAGGLKAVC